MTKITIIVPVYNEEKTLSEILTRIDNQTFSDPNIEKEVLVIDNGSTDRSHAIAASFCGNAPGFRLLTIDKNVGKGHAMKLGYAEGQGEVFIVQDADLEYDPNDYEKLVMPILNGETKFVMGVRFYNSNVSTWRIRNIRGEKAYGFILNLGGIFMNSLIYLLYGVKLYDQATMFKVHHRDLIQLIRLNADRFELETEMNCKLLRHKVVPLQLPINYQARGKKDGKKIRLFKDGFSIIKVILKYRFVPLERL